MPKEREQPENTASNDTPGNAAPGEDDVRAQLKRILSSAEFSVPARLRQFLLYIVNETLSGRSDRIKAYSVAVEVFGRDARLDIQSDPVVRIEAGRLRRALERYYYLRGGADPILIEIPKGGYVPRFQRREDSAKSEEFAQNSEPRQWPNLGQFFRRWEPHSGLFVAIVFTALIAGVLFVRLETPSSPTASKAGSTRPEGPSLIVKPFVNLSKTLEGDYYVTGLGEELLLQLARFKELTVFGRETSGNLSSEASAVEVGQRFGSRYVLEGGVRLSEGRIRVTSRLLHGETSAIVWSGSYDVDPRNNEILDMQMTIASKVATVVAQPYGIIFSLPPRATRAQGASSSEAYQCTYRFYRYRAELDQAAHARTRECLEQITLRHTEYATGWAMLSYLYLDEDRFQLNRRPGSPTPLDRARAAAERAVRLDRENVRALQALMTVLYFSGEPLEALRIGSLALALNPNDTELLGEFGSRVAQSGDWPRGEDLLEQAMARNPGHSDYYLGLLALAAYMQGHDVKAADLIRRAKLRRFSIYHLVAALIFARLGLEAETAQSRAMFLKLRPDFFDNFDGELNKRNFNRRDRAIIIRGAIQAGFPVQPRFAAEAQQLAAPD
ncbi:adenylate cyclase [Bosea sp. NPDC055353]